MELFGDAIERELPHLLRNGVRARFVGRRDRAPEGVRAMMARLEGLTAGNDRMTLWIAFDYGGRAEIVEATRRLVEEGVDPRDVDENAIASRLYAPDLPEPDLLIRTSGEQRMSNFLLWQVAYAELVFVDVLWPDFGERELRRARRGVRHPAASLRRAMSDAVSRVLVAAAGLPIVLGAAWVGGWSLLALLVVAALLSLHELYSMGREFRPLTLAGYAGAVAVLVGVELGGIPWLLGGALLTLPLAFVLVLLAESRQSATVMISFTLCGVVWVAVGLAHAALLRDIPENGRLTIFTVLLTVFAVDTGAYLVGRLVGRHRMAPTISPGKSWEGFVGGALLGTFVCFIAMYDQEFLEIWESLVLGAVIVLASAIGDLMESLVKRDIGVKDSGRMLAGHGGVLDRVDSLLWALPAAFYALLGLGVV